MTDAGAPAPEPEGAHPAGSPGAGGPARPIPSMTAWGRKAARLYLLVGSLALAAMLVETLLGHPGVGTMIAAVLAAPWSMLMAAFAPPLPRDWPMAAGLAVRMAPLALFMLLNAAIVAGMAARSERDFARPVARLVLPLLLAGMLSQGCILDSRQVVIAAAPTAVQEHFSGGVRTLLLSFDLSGSPDWGRYRSKLARVTDLTLLGSFANPVGAPGPGPHLDVTIGVTPDPDPAPGSERVVWGPLRVEYGATRRVEWEEGARLFGPDAGLLRAQVAGDGRFGLVVRSSWSQPALGGVALTDFRVGALFETK